MNDLYKSLIYNAPFGFAHHKIVLNKFGDPIDYIFLDANPAFEKLTGLKLERILNHTILESIPEIKNDRFDWISFYGSIALNNGSFSFIQYSETLKRWYKVTAFSIEKFYFSTFFFDITQEYAKLLEIQQKEQVAEQYFEETQKLAEDLALSKGVLEEALFEKNMLLYELSETKERLEEANREKDKLFSIIAHDLKSPFSGFLGIANLLSTDIESFTKEELVGVAKSLKQSAENVYKLIENLLEWSRLQRGLIPFQLENCNLFSIVEQIYSLQKSNLEYKQIKFSNNIFKDLEVKIDINMISTVFRNLISNAIKFTPKGGEITIRSKLDEKEICISIQDNGIGIPKEMLPILFKLGHKTSRPGTDGESSTGLGLILCKEYVEKHNGKIWVESEEGKGSTFYFTLPIDQK